MYLISTHDTSGRAKKKKRHRCNGENVTQEKKKNHKSPVPLWIYLESGHASRLPPLTSDHCQNLIDKKVILRLFPFSLRSFSSSDLAPPPSRFFVLILKITNSTGGNLNRSIVRFFLDGLEKRPKGSMPGSAIECGPISTPKVTTKCHFKSFLPNSSKWLDL